MNLKGLTLLTVIDPNIHPYEQANNNIITSDELKITSGKTTIATGDYDKVEFFSDYIAEHKYAITFFASDRTMI